MSTFEKQIFMPRGVLGPTVLPPEHRARVARWYSNEWNEFIEEITEHKKKIAVAVVDTIQWHREHCLACRKFRSLKRQRGIIQMMGGGMMVGGGVDCSFTASTIPNLSDFTVSPVIARTRARLFTDGDWYSSTAITGFGASDGTWQGDCAVSGYDSRWNRVSGTVPNASVSGADGVFSDAAVTAAAIGYDNNEAGGAASSGSFNVEIRDGSSFNLLFTDVFTMLATQDAKN